MGRWLYSLGFVTVWLLSSSLDADEVKVDARTLGLKVGPETTVISGPLDKHGYPDYLTALNDRLSAGVSREENFWVLMWPAIGNCERSDENYVAAVERRLGVSIPRQPRLVDFTQFFNVPHGSAEVQRLNDQHSRAMDAPWTRRDCPEIARWVDANDAMFEQVHEACARPKAYAPLVVLDGEPINSPVVGILLPHMQGLRGAARLLVTRAMLRLGEGDSEGSWQDIVDCYRLARHSEAGLTLIESLVGYAVRAIGQHALCAWLSQPHLSVEELLAREAELSPLLETHSLAQSVDLGERWMYLDCVLFLMSGRMDARTAFRELGDYSFDPDLSEVVKQLQKAGEMMYGLVMLGADVNETLKYGNANYDRLRDALSAATHSERAAMLEQFDRQIGADSELGRNPGALLREYVFASDENFRQLPGRMMIGMLSPAISAVERAQTKAEAGSAVVKAALALRRRLASADDLETVVSGFDGGIAGEQFVDPFTGGALHTTFDERGLVISSVGVNGKDDQGRIGGEGGGDADDVRAILSIAP